MLMREQKRIGRSFKIQETKQLAEIKKIEKAQADKEKYLEENFVNKEKALKEHRENIDKHIQMNTFKAQLRKKHHEINLNKIQIDFQKIRDRLIEKFKETDVLSKSKFESDINKLKVKLESELRNEMNIYH